MTTYLVSKKLFISAPILVALSFISPTSAFAAQVSIGGAFTGNREVVYATQTKFYDIGGEDLNIKFCAKQECILVPFFINSVGADIQVGYRSLIGTGFFSFGEKRPANLRFAIEDTRITSASASSGGGASLWDVEGSFPTNEVLFKSGSISKGNGATFTLSVPEPLTLLGAGTALGFGAFFKRELSKKQKKEKIKA